MDVTGTSLRGPMLGCTPVDLIAALGPAESHDVAFAALAWHYKDSARRPGRVWALYDHGTVGHYAKGQILEMKGDCGIMLCVGGDKGACLDELIVVIAEALFTRRTTPYSWVRDKYYLVRV